MYISRSTSRPCKNERVGKVPLTDYIYHPRSHVGFAQLTIPATRPDVSVYLRF